MFRFALQRCKCFDVHKGALAEKWLSYCWTCEVIRGTLHTPAGYRQSNIPVGGWPLLRYGHLFSDACRAATFKKARRNRTKEKHRLVKALELIYLDPISYSGDCEESTEQSILTLLISSECRCRSSSVLKFNKIPELCKEIWVNTFHILELSGVRSCLQYWLMLMGLINL